MRTNVSVAGVLGLVACGSNPPIAYVATVEVTAAWTPVVPPRVDAGATKDAMRALIGEAHDVIVSPEFRAHLAAIATLDGGPASHVMTGLQAARRYLGLDGAGQLPARYRSPGSPSAPCDENLSETADTGIDGGRATICLQAITVHRMISTALEERACAIDTIAHEWSHTIAVEHGSDTALIQDGGHRGAKTPVASYVIGGVAQCTYIERQKHTPMTPAQFKACVEGTGTSAFNPGSCTSAWVDARYAPAR
jgi:hypothetical protein